MRILLAEHLPKQKTSPCLQSREADVDEDILASRHTAENEIPAEQLVVDNNGV
jgi:hypothetical protein